jgi:hypothetical protein
LRRPNQTDDRHLDHSDLDESWAAGEIEVDEQRPTTALTSDPSQRKWMLAGVLGCGLVTALAVLLLTREPPTPVAEPTAEPAELAPAPTPEPDPSPIPDPTNPASNPGSSAAELAKPAALADAGTGRRDATLAASSPAAREASSQAQPKQAPPAPQPAAAPAKPTSGPSPAKPASGPGPAPAPALPSADPSGPSGPTDLPDVEGWDDADGSEPESESEAAPAPEPVGAELSNSAPDPADDDAQV